jgi:DNA-binding PadR family transcriptional regulator
MARTDVDSLLPLTPLTTAILLAVADVPLHGYALAQQLELESNGRIVPAAGTLYAALQRMLDEGLLEEATPLKGEDARRRTYGLTPFGRTAARAELHRIAQLLELGARRKLMPTARGAR